MKHLGIIMDGNRRYAKKNLLKSVTLGHSAGFTTLQQLLPVIVKKEISHVTVWALSNDNLKNRSKEEISGLFKLILKSKELIPLLEKYNIAFDVIGNIQGLPSDVQETLQEIIFTTQKNTAMKFTVALNYGGQDEIIRAVNTILKTDIRQVNEEDFGKYLDTYKLPPADLIIRTGGDIRHSGFLLYSSPYSEYFFTKKLWPEFNEEELDKALDFFYNSKRNFGK